MLWLQLPEFGTHPHTLVSVLVRHGIVHLPHMIRKSSCIVWVRESTLNDKRTKAVVCFPYLISCQTLLITWWCVIMQCFCLCAFGRAGAVWRTASGTHVCLSVRPHDLSTPFVNRKAVTDAAWWPTRDSAHNSIFIYRNERSFEQKLQVWRTVKRAFCADTFFSCLIVFVAIKEYCVCRGITQ